MPFNLGTPTRATVLPTVAEWCDLVAAHPITVALDLGPGQLSPVFVLLRPDITPGGECRLVGKVQTPYQVRPGVRPTIKGRIVLTLAGSTKWEER